MSGQGSDAEKYLGWDVEEMSFAEVQQKAFKERTAKWWRSFYFLVFESK